MPGSPLYPVKLATENLRVKLASSDIKKAELYATYANKRMEEMSRLIDKGRTQHMDTVAQRFNENVTMMSNLPLAEQMETGVMTTQATETAPAIKVASSGDKEMLAPKSFVAREKATVPEATITKDQGLSTTAPPDEYLPPLNDREKLKRAIAYYAMRHPELLRKMLDSDKVLEDVKPAIRRALWASENGYQQALKNLER
jgi:hypothetical protein